MVIVKASCPVHGDLAVDGEKVRLVLFPPRLADRSYYEFVCDRCPEVIRKPANDVVIAMLTGVVPMDRMEIPEEYIEAQSDARRAVTFDWVAGVDVDAALAELFPADVDVDMEIARLLYADQDPPVDV